MVFSNSTGLLKQIRYHEHEVSLPVEQSFCWYNGSDGNTGEKRIQASGAYVFLPNSSSCFPLGGSSDQAIQSVIQGDIVSEVHQQFSPWVLQVVRLYKNAEDVEIDFHDKPFIKWRIIHRFQQSGFSKENQKLQEGLGFGHT